MPARDGTGPRGHGAKTGRGMGQCLPDSSKPASSGKRLGAGGVRYELGGDPRRGLGVGRGLGRGRRGLGRGR